VVLFEEPAVASIAMNGGAPALRDTALLEPEMTIERVDGFVLSGGSAFGLDAGGGVMTYLAEIGRGFEHRGARVPIVPGASLFDLLNEAINPGAGSLLTGIWASTPRRPPLSSSRLGPQALDSARRPTT